jgi:predicted esterase
MHFKKIILALFLSASLWTQGQQVAKTIPNGTAPEGLIGFLEFKPKDYGTQKHPLIIFLHGSGERGNGTTQVGNVAANAIPMLCAKGATMRFTVNGQASSFVVLSPQLSSYLGYWPAYYVKEMIKYAKANLQIDTNRIYVTGLSLGGGGSWVYAFENLQNAQSIAAVAPVCGTDDGWDANACASAGAANLPIWAFHCKDDGTVAYTNTQHVQMTLAMGCPTMTPAPRYTYYLSGGHSGAWVNAYDTGHITRAVDSSLVVAGKSSSINYTASPNLYEWFLMNSRGAVGGITPAPTPIPAPTATVTKAVATVTASGNTVTLDGSASTGIGGISSSGWYITNTAGGYVKPTSIYSGAMDMGKGSPGVTVISLPNGTYNVRLTVYAGVSSSAVTVPLTVGSVTPVGPAVVQVFTAGGIIYTLYSDGTWK